MKKLVMFLAIAGVFASCKPEAIETAFEVNPAEANITVTVLDVNTAAKAEGYTLTADAGTVNGDVVTLKGNKALAETTVTITAAFNGADYSTTVNVNALRAGAKASYGATIVVGSPVSDKEITLEPDIESLEISTAVLYFTPDETGHYGHSVDPDFTHDGISNWVQNLTEFMLNLNVEYQDIYGVVYGSAPCEYIDPAYTNIVDSYVELLGAAYYEEPAIYNCKVSAWAYYTVRQTVYYYNYYVNVLADGEVVGRIPTTEVANDIELVEIANPYGHGHYKHGHGEHSDNANAGGGIIYGE